jgi:hypothetical protein
MRLSKGKMEMPEIRRFMQNRVDEQYEKSRSVKICNRCVELCALVAGIFVFVFYFIVKPEWMQQEIRNFRNKTNYN